MAKQTENQEHHSDILVETRALKKYFSTHRGYLHAVDDVNITIKRGETLGVVGESGCGKSTLGRSILRLIEPTSGEVYFDGEDVLSYSKSELYKMRQRMQIIFQDPYASLNPRMTTAELIAEPIRVCKTVSGSSAINAKVGKLMETVGLAHRFMNSYPHELDGGRRQRIGIARALSLDPDFIVCDEPVSALDVSIQAQILNLLMDLQDERKLTYMFITHDLSVVKHISNEIAVMYMGQCIEQAPSADLFVAPLHPYTQALLNAIPIASIDEEHKLKDVIRGEVTSPIEPKPGCRFATRCPFAKPECTAGNIPLVEVAPRHQVACIMHKC